MRWGSNYNHFWNIWFTLGLYCTLLLLPIAIILILVAVSQDLFLSNTSGENSQILNTVVPGIDFPASELGYYSLSLIICSIFHELGHALMAVKEDVHLKNIGITCFFILPIAYVNISTDRLMSLNPWKALKVLCAGVWHNITLSILSYLILTSLPYTFSLFFEYGNGISVSYITKNSPLLGPRGFMLGDVIKKINDCPILNEDSWYECLKIYKINKPEFCVETDWVHLLDESITLKLLPNGVYDCCDKGKTENLCFEYLDRKDGILEIPPHVCLPVRQIVEKSPQFCNEGIDCNNNLHCIKPLLDNVTNLFKIIRREKPNIVYIGHPSDLTQTIRVSSYIPKHIFKSTKFPDSVNKFLTYIVVFSFSLGVVNLIPVLFMDGNHIIKFVLLLSLKRKFDVNIIITISNIISLCGSIMLTFHCIYTVWSKLF